jgi:hypothetical protein
VPAACPARPSRLAPAALLALLAACGPPRAPDPAPAPPPGDPRDQFFAHLAGLCGARFTGHTVFMADPQPPFADAALVLEVAHCGADELRMPFAVGDDRSRTWVLSRTPEGLLLEHDHRQPDGSPDEITGYGGLATTDGTATRQRFPAHAATAALLPEAATNVWSLELSTDGRHLVYHLERHGAPRYTAELSRAAP